MIQWIYLLLNPLILFEIIIFYIAILWAVISSFFGKRMLYFLRKLVPKNTLKGCVFATIRNQLLYYNCK